MIPWLVNAVSNPAFTRKCVKSKFDGKIGQDVRQICERSARLVDEHMFTFARFEPCDFRTENGAKIPVSRLERHPRMKVGSHQIGAFSAMSKADDGECRH